MPQIQNTPAPLPLVTIITPTYNRASLLPETIESVLLQDYPHIEYIILDDGSSDNTKEIVSHFLERYPGRIHYVYHANKGEAETVNDGWIMAQGDYVMVINSDDPQPPGLVRRSVEIMQQYPETLVTYPNWHMTDITGKPRLYYQLKAYGFRHMLRYAHCFIGAGALINRRALGGRITQLRNKEYPYISDFECWLNIGLLGPFRHIPEPLAKWRSHEGAITSQNAIRMSQMVVDLMENFFQRNDLPAEITRLRRQAMASAHIRLAYREYCENTLRGIKRLIAIAYHHPFEMIRFLCVYLSIYMSQKRTLP